MSPNRTAPSYNLGGHIDGNLANSSDHDVHGGMFSDPHNKRLENEAMLLPLPTSATDNMSTPQSLYPRLVYPYPDIKSNKRKGTTENAPTHFGIPSSTFTSTTVGATATSTYPSYNVVEHIGGACPDTIATPGTLATDDTRGFGIGNPMENGEKTQLLASPPITNPNLNDSLYQSAYPPLVYPYPADKIDSQTSTMPISKRKLKTDTRQRRKRRKF